MNHDFLKREGIDYICNFYRHQKFSQEYNHYLLTIDNGDFIFLNNDAFLQLKKGKILNEELYNLLLKKGIIINSSNFNNVVESIKKRYAFIDNGTSLHIVIPTHRCNINCIYCFAESIDSNKETIKEDMNQNTAKKVTEFIMNSPSNYITIEFQGGDAMMNFEIVKFITEYAKELNKNLKKDLKITIVTNFTLFTEEKANWLIDNDVALCTSLDGPKEIHDKNRFIRGKENQQIGTYETVVFWIKKINEIYKTKKINRNVNALMTITSYSLPYYKEIIDEYLKLNIKIISIRNLTPIGRAFDKSDISYSYDDFLAFYNNCIEYIDKLNKNNANLIETLRQFFMFKIIYKKPTFNTDWESPCGAATGQIVYYTNGNIYTCNEAMGRNEFCIGNVFSDKWQEIFKKKETSKAILNSILENNVICDRCVYKPFCGTCMVENYYNQGKFNFYPTKTSRHHQTISHCNKIYNQIFKEIIDKKL